MNAPGNWQQQPPYQQSSSGKATASLVTGILGLLFCPVILSVVALVTGYGARKEIDASGGRLGGRGNATAGIVMGWIGVALGVIGLIAIILLVALAEDTTNDNDTDFGGVTRLVVAGAARSVGLAA